MLELFSRPPFIFNLGHGIVPDTPIAHVERLVARVRSARQLTRAGRVWQSDLSRGFKAFHIIALIAWMAGMLYLPRLFVYHCDAEPGSRQSETFKIMERRLLRGIINPAMVVTWASRPARFWFTRDGWMTAHWLHAKLTLVMALSGIHGMMARWTADSPPTGTGIRKRFYRIVNEIPAVLMVGIVILVVIKPF